MADYTVKLIDLYTPDCYGHTLYTRNEVESWFCDYELTDFLTPTQIEVINKAGMWTKQKLARKIVDHFDMREIGFETPRTF